MAISERLATSNFWKVLGAAGDTAGFSAAIFFVRLRRLISAEVLQEGQPLSKPGCAGRDSLCEPNQRARRLTH